MRRMIAAGPPSKRPPHNSLAATSARLSAGLATGAVVLLLLLLPLARPAAGEDKLRLGEFIPVTPPQPAPEVTFTDSAGHQTTLGDFHGKPAVVNLWATWCAPCLKEMPSLDRLQARYAGRLRVAAISQDRAGGDVVTAFIGKQKLDHLTVYLDPKDAVAHAFGVQVLPTSIVLNADGRVVGKVEGPTQWDGAAMIGVLEPLLQNAAAPLKHAASDPAR